MPDVTYPRLKKAPISEAVFEILFQIDNSVETEELEKFYDIFKKDYPRKDTITVFEGKIDANNVKNQSLSTETLGYLFLNESKTKAMQIRKNGFSFSISNNSYTHWEPFKDEAWGIFQLYKKTLGINLIRRISLRYINSINLPTNLVDIKEYITIAPEIPKELPFGLSKMFNQITMPNSEIESTGIITQTFDVGWSVSENFEYILDIDVQKLYTKNPSDGDMLSDFDQLRNFKNLIFFKSITQKTQKILEQ